MKKITSLIATFLLVFGMGANAQIAAPTKTTGKLMTAEELNSSTGTKRIAIQLIHQSVNDKDSWYYVLDNQVGTGHYSKKAEKFDETVVYEWVEKEGKHYLKKATEGLYISSEDPITTLVDESKAQAITVVTPTPNSNAGNTGTGWDTNCPPADDPYTKNLCRFVKGDANGTLWINSNNAKWNNGKGVWTMFYVYDLTGHVAFSDVQGDKITGLAQGAKIATFCAPFATEIPADVQAYHVKSAAAGATSVTLEAVNNVIPANQGVVLVSQNANAIMPATEKAAPALEFSVMLGTAANALAMESGNYVLGTQNNVTQFYAATAGSVLKLNKAYMQLPAAMAGSIQMNFGGDATAIEGVEAEMNSDAPVYDLSGRKVQQMVKGGIYIQNGKKFVK